MYDKNRYTYEVKSRVPRAVAAMRPSPWVVLFVVIIALGALVGCGFLGAKLAIANTGETGKATTETTTIIYRDTSDRSEEIAANIGYTGEVMTSQQVAAFARQSVVEVVTESAAYNGVEGYYTTSGAGSGVIISDSGHIITNYHVIQGAKTITVTLYDGQSFNAEWVRGDAVTDIAVIKVNAATANAAVVGISDSVVDGQDIIAIGNPLGKLGGSITKGVISATNREVAIEGQNMSLIQIDASVNPGNSGGGLFDMRGALVGIVNAKSVANDVEGIGFAVPIDVACGIADDLMQLGYVDGRVDTSVLEFREMRTPSVKFPNIGLYLAERKSADIDIPIGAYIISVDKVQIKTVAEWKNVLNKQVPKASVEIVYSYGNRQGVATLKLDQRYDFDK